MQMPSKLWSLIRMPDTIGILCPPFPFSEKESVSCRLTSLVLYTGRMRLRIIVAVFFVSSLTLTYAAPQPAPPTDLQRFYGQIKAVDRSARTITIEMPMRFVFHIRDATKITESGGATASFDQIKAGDGVDVVARHNGNTWTALTIKLKPGAHFPDVISVRTVRGQTVSGTAAGEFLIFQPPIEVVNRNINFGQNSGFRFRGARWNGGECPGSQVARVKGIERASHQLAHGNGDFAQTA
jgi:hypothetical protein